ncbi:recombination-associated protein RdgC [Nitrosomonas eutropha]|uniref:Recombination-associated protein RdgC n=2 Tax=Nitrosomonas eutropha TaxID=916 RepID=A0ABX5M733_9PROT|nr:recombination-associated protein RdgC [Nitrosomonas eutropha]ABI59482.1 putative exonuclease, RdgC [Nitrosomonas eutropha C91]PXV73824.1 recombination associated protein RdgC [Nitrosomonas eutropha]SCX27486.1 recombination associated protein RdgC [Nitrosomonas eutropha]SEJ20610.1 recombination associated protein RdgC [Nitrosomonas eutropha]
MWFKNLQIYRLANAVITFDELEERLAKQTLQGCLGLEAQSKGWVSPGAEEAGLVYSYGQQMLISLGIEKKLLPVSVVNQLAKVRAQEMESHQGYPPGRKQMKDIKEAAYRELLARAFSVRQRSHVWIDPVDGWFVVEGASASRADTLIEAFIKSTGIGLKRVRTNIAPTSTMTAWLSGDEPPAIFSVDSDSIFRSREDKKISVSYVQQLPDLQEITRHVRTGKEVIKLAITWRDRISFILDENLQLKRITLLDIDRESTETAEEQFDSDFFLMTAELRQLLPELMDALGGMVDE